MTIQLDGKLGLPNKILLRGCWAAPIALEQPPSDAKNAGRMVLRTDIVEIEISA